MIQTIKRVDVMKFERLGNIVNIKKGKKPIFSENPTPDSIRVLQIDDLRNDENLKFTEEKKGVFASKEDVLLVWDGANAGTIGHGKEGFIGSTIALLSKKEPEKYSTTFIGLFLQSKFDYLRSKTTGATIPHIDGKVLRDLLIPLPSLETQLHIANLLSKAENLIAQRKESIRLLDEYLKSVFLEMFGDPEQNKQRWESKKLAQLTDVLTGYAFKSEEYSENKDDIKICGGLILYPNRIDWEKAVHWPKEKINGLERYWLKEGDIVMALDRPWITEGFKLAIFKKTDPKALLIQRTARIRCIYINKYYLYFLFSHKSFEKYCKPTETTVPHISPKEIQQFEIAIPPLELQTKFAQIVEKTEAIKAQYQQSLNEMEQLYASLSQRAFKGELALPDNPVNL